MTGLCKHCHDYVPALVKQAGEWVDGSHCANWFRTFPNGCDRFQREPGSDDELEPAPRP